MPPSKKPAPQSKFFKGSDVLEKALPAVKARAVDEKDVRDAAASPSQPVLDYAALVPFRLPRLKTYDSLYSVLFMLLSVAAMFGVHGRRLGAYPTDVIMCTAWCLLDTGSVETWCFRAQASRRSLFALAAEIVAVMFLGTRICVRYGVLYGLFPLILEPIWLCGWRIVALSATSTPLPLACASKFLPLQLFTFIIMRALRTSALCSVLPAVSARPASALVEWLPLIVIGCAAFVLSCALDLVHAVASIHHVLESVDSADDAQPVAWESMATLFGCGFWVWVEELSGVPAPPGGLPPKLVWTPSTQFMSGQFCAIPAQSGVSDPPYDVYKCLGSPTGIHPTSLYSRVMMELTEKPKRVLSRTLLLQVICIGTMSEFVLLFRRWELYLACLVCQFVALVATHAWAYTRIAVAQNKAPE